MRRDLAGFLAKSRSIVIKIGSSTLINQDGVRADWLAELAKDIRQQHDAGRRVVVVSSGAVAMGRRHAPAYLREGETLERKQALAACGQFLLMMAYHEAFAKEKLAVAQLLLTPQDSDRRASFLNAAATLEELLSAGVVPVVNENDSVATEDLRVGDNDRLAARVVAMAGADMLVILSDIDGLYSRPPIEAGAEHLPLVAKITPEVEAMAGGAGSSLGTGGMATKIQAAKMATQSGCHTVVMQGGAPAPLARLAAGERATLFLAESTPMAARKRWLAGQLQIKGVLKLDAGAVMALRQGKSLLPVGVVQVEGQFLRGDAVRLMAPDGQEVAVGLVMYDSDDASRICGLRQELLADVLGYPARKAMVHRDDLVVG